MSDSTPSLLPPNPDPVLNVEITEELIAQHGILADEYEQILKILGRVPNLTELGIFSVMWSEHCAYKNTRKLLRLFPTEKRDKGAIGQVLVKAGDENAGVIDVGDDDDNRRIIVDGIHIFPTIVPLSIIMLFSETQRNKGTNRKP